MMHCVQCDTELVASVRSEYWLAVATAEASAKAKKLRDRAEECRALAQMMTSAVNRAFYLNIAETYDRLAEQQEQLAPQSSFKVR
jgi:hypothetical protein